MAEPIPEKEIEGAYELPEGWVWCKLGDVNETTSGGTPRRSNKEYYDGNIPWLKSGELEDNVITKTEETITELGLKKSSAKIFPTGMLLIALYGATVGKTGKLAIESATNQAICGIFNDGRVFYDQYLWHYLISFRNILIEKSFGGAQPNISQGIIQNLNLPLPPLAEQRRITAKLEPLLTQVNTTKDHLAAVPPIIKRFRQSVLAAACSGRLTEDWRRRHPDVEPASMHIEELITRFGKIKTRRGVPMSVDPPEEITKVVLPSTWTMKPVAALLRSTALIDVKDGNHGANHPKKGEFSDEGLPFITAAQVRNYQIDYVGAQKVSEGVLERLRVGFSEIDDAILTHKGTVGRAALNSKACVLSPQTTYYRCNREVINPQYLVYFFTSPKFFLQLAAVMSQTTRDFVPISEQYRLFLFVPPLPEQHAIVNRIETLFHRTSKVEERVAAATSHADRLAQSILAKAFRGELVPQDPDDEPASVLLERIRKERTELKKKKKPQKRRSKTLSDSN